MTHDKDIDVLSVRDLRIRSSELVRDAEGGRFSIITKWGKPCVLALPFDSRLLTLGIDRDLALHLFEKKIVTLAKAAKIANLPIDQFMDLLSEAGLEAVNYPPEELDEEMQVPI